MRIIILGINGLIGSGLFDNLNYKKNIYIFGTFRDKEKLIRNKKLKNSENIFRFNLKKNNFENLEIMIRKIKPDVIINCIGITKHLINNYSKNKIYFVNSKFPFLLKKLSDKINSRLIQISTDCVFSGKKGNYSENDKPDATDIYGYSKILGEINDKNHLTIRTSTIGFEKKTKHGLLEWFLSQKKECFGFANAFFSGVTLFELSNIIYRYILFDHKVNGICHISSNKISKYELLILFSKYFSKKIKIKKNTDFKIDRSLSNRKFIRISKYKIKSWESMIKKLSKIHNE